MDMMVDNRFNTLTLWSLHPFHLMVRNTKYPEACDLSEQELLEWLPDDIFGKICRDAHNFNCSLCSQEIMAHRKAGGSAKNLRDSKPKYLGTKLSDGSSAQTAAFKNYQVIVPDFGTLTGSFMIASLEYAGEYNGEVTYSITLESNDYITFAAV